MKKILAILVLCFYFCSPCFGGMLIGSGITGGATVYIDDLPCTDNTTSTVVTNSGTGSAWESGPNTDQIYTTVNLGGGANSYLLDAAGEDLTSGDAVTTESFKFSTRYQWTDPGAGGVATANEIIWNVNGVGGATPPNSILFYRAPAFSEIRIRVTDTDDVDELWTSTNWVADTNPHLLALTVNSTAGIMQSMVLTQGATTITFNNTSLPPGVLTLNATQQIGASGSLTPFAYFSNVTFEDLQ